MDELTIKETALHKRIPVIALLGLVLFNACTNSTANIPAPTTTKPTAAPTRTVRVPTATAVKPTATSIPPSPTNIPVTPTITPAPTRAQTRAPLPAGVPDSLDAWQQAVSEISSSPEAQTRLDTLWNTLVNTQHVPLAVRDGVIFMYRGDAASVYWHGDFSFWGKQGSVQGQRVPDTDLWYGIAKFPQDSRTDYQIVLNDAQEILDPANPRRRNDGLDFNNVLTMPDFEITDITRRKKDVPAGTVTEWTAFDSKVMGHAINYSVYLPPNYDALEKLPVLYVTDGERFSPDNIGAMNTVLDNLIAAKRIAPVMAVYIDERDRGAPQNNRRVNDFLVTPEKFAQFITQELVPAIDKQYRTNAVRDARVLVGASFGSVFGTYAALQYPDVFGNLAAFSPAYWVIENPNGAGSGAASGAQRMNDFITRAYNCQSAASCPASPQKIFYSSGIPAWDVGDLNPRAEALRRRGDIVQIFYTQEGHNWGTWSGLTDEMLEYFFARPPQ